MAQRCRFCKKGVVGVLFGPNQDARFKSRGLFACTNCGFGQHGTIVICETCGIIYVGERIAQKNLSTYYEVAKDPLYFFEQKARERTFQRYLSRLEELFPGRGSLLDVGTSTGLFVKLARDRGWEAVGLEPNKWSVAYARKQYGVAIVKRPFSRGVFPKESFSVVTMWDVIEHFTDPVSQLAKVYWYLRPGGMLAFSTVDPESVLARLMGTRWPWYMKMHRVFFSQETAKDYLWRVGFARVEFRSHWRSLSLGYLASRLKAIDARLSFFVGAAVKFFGVDRVVVPYFANDLYDCYAFKKG